MSNCHQKNYQIICTHAQTMPSVAHLLVPTHRERERKRPREREVLCIHEGKILAFLQTVENRIFEWVHVTRETPGGDNRNYRVFVRNYSSGAAVSGGT